MGETHFKPSVRLHANVMLSEMDNQSHWSRTDDATIAWWAYGEELLQARMQALQFKVPLHVTDKRSSYGLHPLRIARTSQTAVTRLALAVGALESNQCTDIAMNLIREYQHSPITADESNARQRYASMYSDSTWEDVGLDAPLSSGVSQSTRWLNENRQLSGLAYLFDDETRTSLAEEPNVVMCHLAASKGDILLASRISRNIIKVLENRRSRYIPDNPNDMFAMSFVEPSRAYGKDGGVRRIFNILNPDATAESMRHGLRGLCSKGGWEHRTRFIPRFGRPLTGEDLEGVRSTNLLSLLRLCPWEVVEPLRRDASVLSLLMRKLGKDERVVDALSPTKARPDWRPIRTDFPNHLRSTRSIWDEEYRTYLQADGHRKHLRSLIPDPDKLFLVLAGSRYGGDNARSRLALTTLSGDEDFSLSNAHKAADYFQSNRLLNGTKLDSAEDKQS